MKPRVFISSTYYDLKYVRENLERVLLELNFEPVLFESNKVTFEHNKPLDQSCFNEVKTCHMMILIIGGRYGSIISDENSQAEKDIYDREYISITRREFETATQNNIPIYILIDKSVYSDYHNYKLNKSFYEKAVKDEGFKFYSVDSINVFRFIESLGNKAIKGFEKNDEIEQYLKDQISGLFYLYLESLKSGSKQNEIYDTVTELKNIVASMNQMVNAVGKSVITDKNSLADVIKKQLEILLEFYTNKFSVDCDVVIDPDQDYENVLKTITAILIEKVLSDLKLYDRYRKRFIENETDEELLNSLNEQFVNVTPLFYFKKFDFDLICDYQEKIKPLISESKDFFYSEIERLVDNLILIALLQL